MRRPSLRRRRKGALDARRAERGGTAESEALVRRMVRVLTGPARVGRTGSARSAPIGRIVRPGRRVHGMATERRSDRLAPSGPCGVKGPSVDRGSRNRDVLMGSVAHASREKNDRTQNAVPVFRIGGVPMPSVARGFRTKGDQTTGAGHGSRKKGALTEIDVHAFRGRAGLMESVVHVSREKVALTPIAAPVSRAKGCLTPIAVPVSREEGAGTESVDPDSRMTGARSVPHGTGRAETNAHGVVGRLAWRGRKAVTAEAAEGLHAPDRACVCARRSVAQSRLKRIPTVLLTAMKLRAGPRCLRRHARSPETFRQSSRNRNPLWHTPKACA